jgi:hypothetical protein
MHTHPFLTPFDRALLMVAAAIIFRESVSIFFALL